MNTAVCIQLIPGSEAAVIADPIYEQEGKSHRARNSDLFFAAFIENTIIGVCRFCIEENTPMLRSMVIHAPLRSRKIGTKILESLAQYLDKNNFRPTYCIPYAHLGNFYGLIGFKVINDEDAPAFLIILCINRISLLIGPHFSIFTERTKKFRMRFQRLILGAALAIKHSA